jgi:prevent-host-death family protein
MIKTIGATELRNNFKEALLQVKKSKKPLIITERGIATSVLVNIDEYEDYLSERDVDFVSSIKKAKMEIAEGTVFSFDDVFGKIS